MVGGRRRHPKKELEALIREAEAQGWRVDSKTGYFKLKCSCPEALQDDPPDAIRSQLREEPAGLVLPTKVLAAMRYTATFHGMVKITESSSAVDRTLSEGDFEFMLDSLNDALSLHSGLENLSVGASLQSGELEVTFVVEATDLVDAQRAALEAFNEANTVAAQGLAGRIGSQLSPEWTSSHTDLAQLIPA
jgi:hypothetical protein